MQLHTRETLYLCEHDGCGKSFIRSDELQSHVRTHTVWGNMYAPGT